MVGMRSFGGWRVLVTGGSRGIGQAIVEGFAGAGADVALSFRTERSAAEKVAARAAEAGVRAFALQADFSDATRAETLVQEAAAVLGGLDVVVNSAGIYPHASIEDTTFPFLRELLGVNLEAPFGIIRAATTLLSERPGSVVNLTSIDAFGPTVGLAAYAASKAALATFTRSAALELGPRGIRVNAVAPGLVWAPGIEKTVPDMVRAYLARSPLRRLVRPEEVASAVLFLASDGASAITGQTLVVDAGVTLPGYAYIGLPRSQSG